MVLEGDLFCCSPHFYRQLRSSFTYSLIFLLLEQGRLFFNLASLLVPAPGSLLSVLPGDVPSGRITWTPFHCDRYDCGYPRSDVSNTTSYSAVTQKPGGDMSKSGSRPDCAVWTSERDGKAIVYVSMRCRNTPLPYELMFVEFSPTPALDPGELAVIRNIQIRLPKSPVTAPGFKPSEFPAGIQSK